MARRAGIPGGRKVALNMKTTPDIRAKLEAVAHASGRTLTHEVEYQVERALIMGDLISAIRETVRQEMRAEFEARLSVPQLTEAASPVAEKAN